MHGPYLKRLQPLSILTYLALVVACRWWLVEAQTRIKLPHVLQLQSTRLHWPLMLHNIDLHGIFECEIYGKWLVQASIDTHTPVQCSHASVGLAQTHPSNTSVASFPDLPRFNFSVCVQYNTRKRKSAKNGEGLVSFIT